jgi:hypothetical protein
MIEREDYGEFLSRRLELREAIVESLFGRLGIKSEVGLP